MSTTCACCWPRDDVTWVPYGNHLWVRMAEYDRLRTALEEADQALNGGDQDYAIVGATDIIHAALKGAM